MYTTHMAACGPKIIRAQGFDESLGYHVFDFPQDLKQIRVSK